MTTYTFIIGTQEFDIEVEFDTPAGGHLDAMVVANHTLDLPDRFYGWMPAGPNRYHATTGVWD